MLDLNKDGTIDFDEFLVGIRGKPNLKRQTIIDKVLVKFDKNGSGVVNVTDLKNASIVRSTQK